MRFRRSLHQISVIFCVFLQMYFLDIYIFMRDGVATLKYRLVVDVISVRELLCYSNHIFHGPNKHNPFSGHRVYLCRF